MPRSVLVLRLAALAVALGGCSPDPVALMPGGDESGDAGTEDDDGPVDGGDASTDGGPVSAPPVLRAVPDAVAPGGRLYLVGEDLPRRLIPDIDGHPLGEPLQILQADYPGALYAVPDDLPLGDATLFVRREGEPLSVTEHPLRIEARRFVDVAANVGLDLVHDPEGSPPECAESHTGLAFGDVDGDDAPDVFVGNVGSGGRLMRNSGRSAGGLPRFEDATESLGLSGIDQVAMATFIDLDGDGDQDLFVGRRGPNVVMENRLVPDGEATFVDVTAALGLGEENQRTMGVAFGDYDGDEDLDLYVVNHAFCFPASDREVRAEDHLYENVGGVFEARTPQITGPSTGSVGFSASWIDIDGDVDVDLVIINDDVGGSIGDPNAVWRNDGPGDNGGWRFTDVSIESGVALDDVNGMGLALGDINHDGAVDMAFTNIGDNVVLLGDGNGQFADVSEASGATRGSLPWGRNSITWAPHLLDHDNDGDLDLYFSGGRIKGTSAVPDAFLDNVAARGDDIPTFEDRTWVSGMAHPGHGKASVLVDVDRDGALDIVSTAWGEALAVYHNRSAVGHWLVVELVGRGANREAVGAVVSLTADGATQTCFHTNRPSLGGGGETACHFGLGEATTVDEIEIRWPDGEHEVLPGPDVDQRVRFSQPP